MTRRAFTCLAAVGVVAGGMFVATTPAYAETVPSGQVPAAGRLVPAAAFNCTGDIDSSPRSAAVSCISGPGTQYRVSTSCKSPKNSDGYPAHGPWVRYGAPGVSRHTCQRSGYHTSGFGVGHN
jgi:hypothetical protein